MMNRNSMTYPNDIIFYYGSLQPITNGKVEKLAMNFISSFPKPKFGYVLVYLNNYENLNASASLADFKKMLTMMPLDYFRKMKQFIILKPTMFFTK